MSTVSLILGGARSGKSTYAERAASAYPQKIYLATAPAQTEETHDEEMTARIKQHIARRGPGWETIEQPLEIADSINAHSAEGAILLLDCATLWLSNMMFAGRDADTETKRLIAALDNASGDVIIVSNEVGLSIVPENALARAFRDAQGRLNQKLASRAENVVFIAAGLPLLLKGEALI